MAIVKEITTSGQNTVSTLSGSIRLEEGRGRLVVYDSISNIELTTLDRTGFLTTDGTTSTRINPPGIVQNDGTNDRIILGDDSKL